MPALSVAEVRALDRLTIEEVGIPGRLMMEVAGFGACALLRGRFNPSPAGPPVLVAAGRGNNAGDGFVVARYLAVCGVPVRVLCLHDPDDLDPKGDAGVNARLLARYAVALEPAGPTELAAVLGSCQVLVDGLLGTGLRGDVREPYRAAIETINAANVPVLALDLPSGLCGDTGQVLGAAVRADCTATFGAIKKGMLTGEGPARCGAVELVPLPFPPDALPRNLRHTRPEPSS